MSACTLPGAASWLAFLVWIGLLPSVARGEALELVLRQGPAADGGTITAVLSGRNLAGLGALEVELVYDPTLLEARSASKRGVLANGMLEVDLRPDRVRCVMISGEALATDGELLAVDFLAKRDSGEARIGMEELQAWGFGRGEELLVRGVPGTFDLAIAPDSTEPELGVPARWLVGAFFAGIVFLTLLLWVYRQGQKRGAAAG